MVKLVKSSKSSDRQVDEGLHGYLLLNESWRGRIRTYNVLSQSQVFYR